MSALCGMLGDVRDGLIRNVARALHGRGVCELALSGPGYAVYASNATTSSAHFVSDGTPKLHAATATGPQITDFCRTVSEGRVPRESLTGSFAFVHHNPETRTWCLVRDRLGRKPLYYTISAGSLVFASELKALLRVVETKRLNLEGVDRYLALRYNPGADTLIRDIHRVLPGHALILHDGKTHSVQYATFTIEPERDSKHEAALRLQDTLANVIARTESDDVLFSSGIDSATIVALKQRAQPGFVTLERAWQDESRLARESAKRLRVPLQEEPGQRLSEESFSETIRALEEPIADPTIFPLWSVFKAARTHGDAFVCGFGADELLGGYPRYNFLRQAHGAHRLIPGSFVAGLQPVMPPNAFVRRAGQYLSDARTRPTAVMSLLEVFGQGERDEMYTRVMKASLPSPDGPAQYVAEHFVHSDITRNMLSLDLRAGIPDLLLLKCERLASAHGIELDFPFLDDAIVDFATHVRPHELYGVRSKALLRKAMRGILPGRTLLSARRDFHVPQEGRSAGVIDSFAEKIITVTRVNESGILRWPFVEQVMRGATHNVYRRRQFWALLIFFAWYREFIES